MYGFVVIIKNLCYVICFTWTEIASHFVNNLFYITTVEYAYKCGAKFSSNILCNICYRPTVRRQITYLNKHLLLYNYRTCVCLWSYALLLSNIVTCTVTIYYHHGKN